MTGVAAGTATITVTASAADYTDGTATFDVEVTEAPEELAVSSVSADSATTVAVTFNQDVTADTGLTFTFAGSAVAADNVAYDGAVATLTVATMVDDAENTIVITDSEATEVYNSTVTYDKNEITTVTIQNIDFNKTIGNDFELTALVADEDGDAIADTEVKLEAVAEYDTNNLEPAVIQTATTDADGIASFSWTTAHDGSQNFEVYSVTRPVVRDSGTVVWTLADQLVTVDAMTAVTLGDNTAKEFNVTASNADGAAYTGNLVIDLDGDTDIDAQAAGGQNVKFEMWDTATEAWVGVADARVTETSATRITVDMTNESGALKFRLYNYNDGVIDTMADVDTITPTIFEDADAGNDMDTTEARVVGSTISYVAQTPTITFTQNEDITTIATSTHADDVVDLITYNLSAVDQYGNPFRGTVKLNEYAAIDNDVTTVVASNAFSFTVDTNADGDYTDGADIGAAGTQALDFKLGGDDPDNDSSVIVKLTNSNGADTIEPTAFVDVTNTTTVYGKIKIQRMAS